MPEDEILNLGALDIYDDEDEDEGGFPLTPQSTPPVCDGEDALSGADFLIDQQYPQVAVRDWMTDCKFVLVNQDNLAACIDHCINAPHGYYALDLETTGLDNRVFYNAQGVGETVDKIVGVCMSPDGVTGYYIPLRHTAGAEHNIPWDLFEEEFRRLIEATMGKRVRAVFHGGIFDQEFLTYWGGEPFGDWDKPSVWEDTEILYYLQDSRRKNKQLKYLSEQELHCDQIELHELFPEGHTGEMDFATLDPGRQEVLWYGGGDGIMTYRHFDNVYDQVVNPEDGRSQKSIYGIEKSCVGAVRWMHRNRIYRDKSKVLELLQLGQQEWFESIFDLYEAVSEVLGRDVMPGYYKAIRRTFESHNPNNLLNDQIQRAKNQYQALGFTDPKEPVVRAGKPWPAIYDVASPKQLGEMFWELGVPGLVFTEKSGQVKTSRDILDAVIESAKDKYPYMGKIKRFREVHKALTNYLFPMLEWADPTDGTMRINFRAHKVDTGRFATPAKAKVQLVGWPQMNLQSVPATYDPERPECMRRLRECIAARPPKSPEAPRRYIVAIDFSGVELRLVTNLSREPKWMAEFFRCSSCSRTFDKGDGTCTPEAPPPRCPNCGSDKIGDLHTLTALNIFGEDALDRPNWKQLRQDAKATNFALCYGGGGNAVIRATGCSKNEGWRVKRQFDETYKTLASWWRAQWDFARKHEYVLTAFGRKYPVPDINSEDGGFRSKAERNSVNGPIQGCLHGGSRVPTSLGIRRIEDLSGKTFDVWTGTCWAKGRAFPSGLKKLMHTTLMSGLVMRTSPDHRFRVYEEGLLTWVRQEDLTPDMWVVTDAVGVELPDQVLSFEDKKGYRFEGNHDALWELLGLVIGDGSIQEDGLIIHVGGPDAAQQARYYADRLAPPLGLAATVKEKPRVDGDGRLPTWQVCFWNTAFREFCRMLGLGDWNTWTKRVPEAVWAQSARHRAAFLRGYFSAEGCVNVAQAVDVRSTNPDLLMDTHKLLRTLGIRSTVRLDSKRVFVKDRVAFRNQVGFLIPEESARLWAIESNPRTGQWHTLPQDLIRRIGETVYGSSIYADLQRSEKSAVLRLRAGSGSKSQCQRYLAKLPPKEVPSTITALLEYNYEQVVEVEDTGEPVEMFDVEVKDCVHAFVCDGVVVHNSSADITKIAMALVYKEMKQRGWDKDKVLMIITMHDELVFDISGDVLEEAIEIIKPLMSRNAFILAKKWPIPLTSDVEIGHAWDVEWDLNAMRAGEVRFNGNKKYKKPDKAVADGLVWGEMSKFPAELAPYFRMHNFDEVVAWSKDPSQRPEAKPLVPAKPVPSAPLSAPVVDPREDPELSPPEDVPLAYTGADGDPDGQSALHAVQDEAVAALAVAAVESQEPAGPPMGLKKGDEYIFELRGPLRYETVDELARVIIQCRGKGTRLLRIKLPDGTMLEELEPWKELFGDEAVLVNESEFFWTARARRLC